MSDFRYVTCPYCGQKSVGKYRVDMDHEQTTYVSCRNMKCRKAYTVVYGKNKVRVMK